MMNVPRIPNGIHRELTTIPGYDMSLARQEAARIAQAAASRPHPHASHTMGSQRSLGSQAYDRFGSSGLTNIPSLPQVGVSALAPYTPPAPIGDSTALVPYVPPAPSAVATATEQSPKKNIFSMDNLKGMFDRVGGVDGIVATMGQAQRVMASVQQFAPMAKLLMGSFLKKKDSDEVIDNTPRRRRRKKRRSKKRSHVYQPSGSQQRRKTSRSRKSHPSSRPIRRTGNIRRY